MFFRSQSDRTTIMAAPTSLPARRCPVTRPLAFLTLLLGARVTVAQVRPKVTAPPDAFFEKFRQQDREAARKFYKKFLDVKGLSVAAAGEVADEALLRTHHVVTHLLAGRPDVLETMAKNGTRLIII